MSAPSGQRWRVNSDCPVSSSCVIRCSWVLRCKRAGPIRADTLREWLRYLLAGPAFEPTNSPVGPVSSHGIELRGETFGEGGDTVHGVRSDRDDKQGRLHSVSGSQPLGTPTVAAFHQLQAR
jgi:hypothetical protein